jgi:hypothetical protein
MALGNYVIICDCVITRYYVALMMASQMTSGPNQKDCFPRILISRSPGNSDVIVDAK